MKNEKKALAPVAAFDGDHALAKFAKRNRLKFAGAHMLDEKGAEEFVRQNRADGLAVVKHLNYVPGQPAYLAFHRP